MVRLSRDLVQLAGLDEIVHVLEGPASESLRTLYDEGKVTSGGVDMAFIDHWEEYYLPDLQLCEKLGVFHKGSLVIADNTDFPGAPKYLEYVRSGGSGAVRYESEGYTSQTKRGPVSISCHGDYWGCANVGIRRVSSKSALLWRSKWYFVLYPCVFLE